MPNFQSPISNSQSAQAERERYVRAFNATMVRIWREQITLLGVIDTGALYRSTVAIGMTADDKFTSVTLSQAFNTYGIFVDYGTGSRKGIGNPETENRAEPVPDSQFHVPRRRRRWFSRKYYASVMNIQEFFADNLGREGALIISSALSPDTMRKAVTL